MENMSNEWSKVSTIAEDVELRVVRLQQHCLDLQDKLDAAARLDKSNSSAIFNLTKACEESAANEREACAVLLDNRAKFLRSKAVNENIGNIRNLDMAALVLSDAADMIRNRK